jgi:hypothetical protein
MKKLLNKLNKINFNYKVTTISLVGKGKAGRNYEITVDPRNENKFLVWPQGQNIRLYEFDNIEKLINFLTDGDDNNANRIVSIKDTTVCKQ